MDYKVEATLDDSNARAGLITTDHGQIETPIFMPVGTVGSVKAVHFHELRVLHASCGAACHKRVRQGVQEGHGQAGHSRLGRPLLQKGRKDLPRRLYHVAGRRWCDPSALYPR